MDDPKQRLSGLFNRAASAYDRTGPRFFSQLGACLVERVQLQPGNKVLDIATGRGAHLIPTATAVGLDGWVTGIDLSEGMVQETAREIQSLGLKNVEVRQMDAEQLQFPDETFDCVLCGFAIFFFPDLDRAMAEMRRVLKTGGRIAISTWEKSGSDQWQWYEDLVTQYLPPAQAAEEEQVDEDSSDPVFDTPEGLTNILLNAGFREIAVEMIATEAVYASKDEWWAAQWSHGGRSTLERIEEKLGQEGLERFKQAVYDKLESRCQEDGIHFHWPALCGTAKK